MFPRLIKIAAFTLLGLGSTPAFADNGMAMTWKAYSGVPSPAVRVGCFNICDAYHGDTSIKEKHQILCIVPGNSAMPTAYGPYATALRPNNWQFYMGWSGGEVGVTAPIRGSDITSRAVGDGFCKEALHDGNARMAEHHDNKAGGWSLGARIHANSPTKGIFKKESRQKFWVAINDQPANPWN